LTLADIISKYEVGIEELRHALLEKHHFSKRFVTEHTLQSWGALLELALLTVLYELVAEQTAAQRWTSKGAPSLNRR
jgi:hypothetical protein